MHAPTIRGEMVTLRPIGVGDAEAVWSLRTDPDSQRMSRAVAPRSRDEVADWCAAVDEMEHRYDWAITVGGRPEMVGEVVLEDVDPAVRSASVRIRLSPGHRGRGYAREATMLVGRFAFAPEADGGIGLHRVALEVLSINARAVALYESLGFVVEGRLRDVHLDGSRYCDAILMSMLDEEYQHASRAWR